MKRTYTGTMTRPELRTAEIEIEAYDTCKYYGKPHGVSVTYNGITAWDIIEGGKEAEEIEKDTDCIDDFHEYLVLHLLNGETATFRNSYVDILINTRRFKSRRLMWPWTVTSPYKHRVRQKQKSIGGQQNDNQGK